MTLAPKTSRLLKTSLFSLLLAGGSLVMAGCAQNPTNDPALAGLPIEGDWRPIMQTQEEPIISYYVNVKDIQQDAQNKKIYQGKALQQPIWYSNQQAEGNSLAPERLDFSLNWTVTVDCESRKISTQNYNITKGLFGQGEVVPVNLQDPYTEESDIGKKLLMFYCKK